MYRKIPRSSFMINPLGEAATTSIESPPIMSPIHPIYVVSPPITAQPVPAAPSAQPPFSITYNGRELPPVAKYVAWGVIGWCVYSGVKNALDLFQKKVP